MIIAILKAVLPVSVRQVLMRIRARLHGREYKYRGMENAAIFDDIYENSIWGVDKNGASFSGSGSHNANVVEPYVSLVKGLLEKHQVSTIVDLGCGDFNVGKNFAAHCDTYIACDVSSVIVERNRDLFGIENVEFRRLDISKDELPAGDMAFVRQVLQHLSNADIESFVKKVHQNSPYKHLLITEHLPAGDKFTANANKVSGKTTRINLNSGVDLEKPPFNLKYRSKEVVLEIPQDTEGFKAVIRCTLYGF